MKIIEKEFNVQTGEETITERDETAAETKARLDYEKEIAHAKAKAEAKAIEKAALLVKLGITDDEAKLLLS
jgi:regulator of protease activity HflC (stomatin/prohibitin superfamily)